MRTLVFTEVSDIRFNKNPIKDINEIIDKLVYELNNIKGVKFKKGNIIEFTDNSCAIEFMVQKDTRKTTWNDIYGVINSVKATKYNFINCCKF